MTSTRLTTLALAATTLAFAACGGGSDDGATAPTGSGATCPPGSTLRYEGGGNGSTEPASFAKTFFDTRCIGCHSTTISAPRAAPIGVNFDTLALIKPHLDHIDHATAAGPNNPAGPWSMPPGGGVTVEERTRLGQWIACGAP